MAERHVAHRHHRAHGDAAAGKGLARGRQRQARLDFRPCRHRVQREIGDASQRGIGLQRHQRFAHRIQCGAFVRIGAVLVAEVRQQRAPRVGPGRGGPRRAQASPPRGQRLHASRQRRGVVDLGTLDVAPRAQARDQSIDVAGGDAQPQPVQARAPAAIAVVAEFELGAERGVQAPAHAGRVDPGLGTRVAVAVDAVAARDRGYAQQVEDLAGAQAALRQGQQLQEGRCQRRCVRPAPRSATLQGIRRSSGAAPNTASTSGP